MPSSSQSLEPDFHDMLGQLLKHGVEFLLVGAHAVGAHRIPRYTQDLDIWIRPTMENARRVWRALAEFGAPLNQFTPEDFANPRLIAQFGVAPVRIDLIAGLSGLTFESAWVNRMDVDFDGLTVPVLGKNDLIRNKRAAGRAKDLIDADLLEGIDPDRHQRGK